MLGLTWHHIAEDLQAIAIWIEEIERTAAAATDIAATFKAMDEWTADRLHPFGVQMGQGFEKGIAVLDLASDELRELVGNVYPNKFERSEVVEPGREDTITALVDKFRAFEPKAPVERAGKAMEWMPLRSASSGSVMIVAGLLLTSTTSSPSARSALHACVPE